MSKCTFSGIVLSVLTLLLAATADAGDREKGDTVARTVVERFSKAFANSDVEEMIKVVDVPWCHDGREIIKDRDKLNAIMREMAARGKRVDLKKLHIRKIATLQEFAAAKQKPLAREHSLTDVLPKDHRVVLLEIERPGGGGFERVWIGVRLEMEQAKIVGLLD